MKYLIALMFISCSDYTIVDPKASMGVPNPPPVVEQLALDHIIQQTEPMTDVLFVIDNSCSMLTEQAMLVESFPSFMNHFLDSEIDWHVGVISTDMSRTNHKGQLQQALGWRWITPETPLPHEVFYTMARMGTSGSGTEKGLDAVFEAIEVHDLGYNAGFYRPEAHLSVIIISDENDYSHIQVQEFISWFTYLKDEPDKATFSSIVCLTDVYVNDLPCYVADVGTKYIAATAATGGIAYDIREPNWDTVLDEIGILSRGPVQEFFLSDIPVPSSIEVWVEIHDEAGVTVYNFVRDVDYLYSPTRNSISFITYVPPQHSHIYVSYRLLANSQLVDTGKQQEQVSK